MIEISSTSSKKDEKTRIKSRKTGASASKTRDSFGTSLHSVINLELSGTVEELMRDLDDQEKRFLDQQTIYELEKYKAMVHKILKTVMDEGFRTTVLKRARADRSDYLIVEKIDKKLDEIQAKIARSAGFNLLKEIEEIRGLILDLVY